MEQTRYFHPTIDGSIQRIASCPDVQNDELLFVAAMLLHQIGWRAQQGFSPDACVEPIRRLLEQDTDGIIQACAAGIQEMNHAGKLKGQ